MTDPARAARLAAMRAWYELEKARHAQPELAEACKHAREVYLDLRAQREQAGC